MERGGYTLGDRSRVWDKLAWAIRQIDQKGHPTRRDLATLVEEAIEASGGPHAVAQYVGARIRDEIVIHDRWRVSSEDTWARTLELQLEVAMSAAAFEIQGIRGPRTRALEVVAKRRGVQPSSIRKRIQREAKRLPRLVRDLVPSTDQMRAVVMELEESSQIELNPERGFDWLGEPKED